ncbi:MAG: M20/M25/M40 family metallo-hydrolase, partial [Planctomycetes bacterium]|nr:M20/M25/M40 family metallo-hydrolase [Planctomycetota bacterium]
MGQTVGPMNAELQSDILQRIQARREAIIAFTQALLRIPTANTPPSGNEKPAQAFLAEKLAGLGFEVDLFCLDEVPGLTSHPAYRVGGSVEIARDYRDRPDLAAVWKGRGRGPSLIVASHVDVVPPGDPAQWRYDPWSGTRTEGRIYARGAIDAKGPLAAAVMAMACLREMGLALDGDLIFQSFVDEEYGGGNGALATILRGYRADGALMLEPTDLVVCPATYGCQSFK